MSREVEDVAQLIHHIQSRLPVREAARTSVLSKSWLHAWSTIPMLRFNVGRGKCMMKLVDVDRTLIRYLRDNIPIERFALTLDIENQESALHAEKWIGPVATKTCLKDFYLSIIRNGASFTLPNDILSGVNLTTIRISASCGTHSVRLTTSVINCVSLRELYLDGVCISEEVFHDILSSCSLLVRIVLLGSCEGFKTIKVKSLPRLYELQIAFDAVHPTVLEISDVPNLGVLSYDLALRFWLHEHPPSLFNAYPISFGSRVTQLMLGGVIKDNACLHMIQSQFPILESLTLRMKSWMSESFHFTCASLTRLSLVSCPNMLINLQVYAPKLLSFEFDGGPLPSLLFPASSLKRLNVSLSLDLPVDANFFLKMREALTLSRNCYFRISTNNSQPPLEIDIDDLRRRLLLPPAKNVHLSFETRGDECLWERSTFFDAFFEICHPKHVFANPDFDISHNNHFCRVMLRELLEKKTTATTAYWPHCLKHVQIRQNLHQKWKSLTNSHRSFLDGSASDVYLEFKLNWC